MSFLFGRKTKSKDRGNNYEINQVETVADLGSYQPENPYKDILILPSFANIVRHTFVIDEKRFVLGDDDGNLTVWNCETGTVIANLRHHKTAISGITMLISNNDNRKENEPATIRTLVALGMDKCLSAWDESTYKLVNSVSGLNSAHKVLLNVNNDLLLVAGMDLKVFDSSLNSICEYKRKNNENSIKYLIKIRNDHVVAASNFDIEIYLLKKNDEDSNSTNKHNDSIIEEYMATINEVKRYVNTHKDSILCLENISDIMFASGSTDGHIIIWLSQTLIRSIELQPFSELNKNEALLRLNLTAINSMRSLYERFIVIASGNHLCIYDNINKDYSCRIINAHNCKITDILILKTQLVTSAEDGTLRIWKIVETYEQHVHADCCSNKIKINLVLIGECLGHSASIMSLSTVTKNEIISSGFDNMVIIWRNSEIMDYNRNIELYKILSNVQS